jgi:hypothetical protein
MLSRRAQYTCTAPSAASRRFSAKITGHAGLYFTRVAFARPDSYSNFRHWFGVRVIFDSEMVEIFATLTVAIVLILIVISIDPRTRISTSPSVFLEIIVVLLIGIELVSGIEQAPSHGSALRDVEHATARRRQTEPGT